MVFEVIAISRWVRGFRVAAFALAGIGCGDTAVDSSTLELRSRETLSESDALESITSGRIREADGQPRPDGGLSLLDTFGDAMEMRYTSLGTPRSIYGPGFRVTAEELGVSPDASARVLADAFTRRYASLWRVDATDFETATVEVERRRDAAAHLVTVSYRQRWFGVEVAHARMGVVVDTRQAAVIAVVGSFRSIPDTAPSLCANVT